MSSSMAVLGLLAQSPRHGYDIKRAYDVRFPQARPLAFGQVYATLARFDRDGWVDVAGREGAAGPERTMYSLTPAGQAQLQSWLAAPEPPAPFVANELFLKVVVALMVGSSAGDYLQSQRAAHLARMRELTTIKSDEGASLSDRLSADYAIAHLDADLGWIDDTAQRLDALAGEVAGS